VIDGRTFLFVTVNGIEVVSTKTAMKPAGTKLLEWNTGWES
jgi:hypothetical protein